MKKEKKKKSDLFIRLRSGLIYSIVILVCSFLGNFTTMLMIAAASGICAFEFYKMLKSDAKLPNELLGVLASVAFPVVFYFFNIRGVIFVTGAFVVCLLI